MEIFAKGEPQQGHALDFWNGKSGILFSCKGSIKFALKTNNATKLSLRVLTMVIAEIRRWLTPRKAQQSTFTLFPLSSRRIRLRCSFRPAPESWLYLAGERYWEILTAKYGHDSGAGRKEQRSRIRLLERGRRENVDCLALRGVPTPSGAITLYGQTQFSPSGGYFSSHSHQGSIYRRYPGSQRRYTSAAFLSGLQRFPSIRAQSFQECHDLKDKNDMTLINKSQVLFGQAQSYTFWHVENLNMSSINYLHSGKRKYWIILPFIRILVSIAEKHADQLKQLFKEKGPLYYKCRSAELYAIL
ncbi:hypothetical protein OUZ56_012103 [Daphnia magna]|uniref:JmjC domain-containing protein n=1 Tax=Daphnia magna TaxID=35525 RepID=A0ABQ9Z213_9CRUS|nr:hypothetical protein OUZ56_012103 [Daphnia magna]